MPIAKAGIRVIGVDGSEGMLAVAREPFGDGSLEFVWLARRPL